MVFFSSVELAKSRLSYLPISNLHFSKIDEIRLKNASFFATVVLENMPQVESSCFVFKFLFLLEYSD